MKTYDLGKIKKHQNLKILKHNHTKFDLISFFIEVFMKKIKANEVGSLPRPKTGNDFRFAKVIIFLFETKLMLLKSLK